MSSGLGLQWDGLIIEDPIQTVRVSFLSHPGFVGAQLGLLEPLSERSKVASFLSKGGGCHHLCYEVDDLELALQRVRRSGAVIIQKPVPAVAFQGRHIAWVFTADRLLVEFLAAGDGSSSAEEISQG